MTALSISEFAVMAGIQFSSYVAEGATLNYLFGSLCFDDVEGVMLLRLPTPMWDFFTHSGLHKVALMMSIGRDSASLAIYHVAEIDRTSSGGSNDSVSYYFATGIVEGYPAE